MRHLVLGAALVGAEYDVGRTGNRISFAAAAWSASRPRPGRVPACVPACSRPAPGPR